MYLKRITLKYIVNTLKFKGTMMDVVLYYTIRSIIILNSFMKPVSFGNFENFRELKNNLI